MGRIFYPELQIGRVNPGRFHPSDVLAKYGGFFLDAEFGVTGAALPTVDSWAPTRDTMSLGSAVQAGAASKPTLGTLGGRSSIQFETDEFLKFNSAATAWKWLHAAAGFSLFIVVKQGGGAGVQKLLDTTNGNQFQHGIAVEFNTGSGRFDFMLTNGSGTVLWYDGLPGIDPTEEAIYEVRWSEAAGVLIRKNGGVPVTGSVVGVPSTTDPSGALAIGSITAGTVQFYFGDIEFVQIVPGVMSEPEAVKMLKYLGGRFGVTLSIPTVTYSLDCSTDPRIVLPSRLHTLVSEPAEVYIRNAYFRDGYCPQSASSDLTIYTLFQDRWRLFPTAVQVGTGHNFSIISAGVTETAALTVSAQLGGGAPVRSVVFVGDSRTAPGVGTFVQYVKDALGAKLTLLGTQAGGGYPNEGHAGRTTTWFATDPASPFTTAGGALDIPAYITAIGATPDFVVWNPGPNEINSVGNLDILESSIDGYWGDLEAMIQAWRVAAPSTKHIVCTPNKGNMNDAAWGGEVAREFYQLKAQRFIERTFEDFDNRVGENIFVSAVNLYPDLLNGFTDGVHENSIGHTQEARPMKAALVSLW